MQGKALSIFGDGEQTRAFSYISEVVDPMINCLDHPEAWNQVYNVGADRAYTVKSLADVVRKAMGSKQELLHLPPRNEVLHANADHQKVLKAFGAPSPVSLEDGIQRMANWALKHGPREPSKFGAIEIEEGLPSFWTTT
jgi:UDP-glucose 4-epimerase